MNVLVLLHPGTNSRSILLDAARGVEEAGHRVLVLDMGPMWESQARAGPGKPRLMSEHTAQLRSFIRANAVQATMGLWANGLLSLMNSAALFASCSVSESTGAGS